jgi:hypothetical protein
VRCGLKTFAMLIKIKPMSLYEKLKQAKSEEDVT